MNLTAHTCQQKIFLKSSINFLTYWSILLKGHPDKIVDIVLSALEKSIPKDININEFLLEKASKFIIKTNNVSRYRNDTRRDNR